MSRLFAKALTLFRYQIMDQQGKLLGEIKMPDKLAMARNSPSRGVLPKSWEEQDKLDLQGQIWRLEYAGFGQQAIRYFLVSGDQADRVIASVAKEGP